MRRAAGVALVAALAAASAAPAQVDVPTRDCGSRIESGRAPLVWAVRGYLVVGPAALSGLSGIRRELPPPDESGRVFAKSALLLRAGHTVTLRIPPRFRDRIALAHARTPQPVSAVRFVACPPRTRAFSYDGVVGRVTGFNGGFVLTRAGCYPVDVEIDGRRTVRVRIPFGFPCR